MKRVIAAAGIVAAVFVVFGAEAALAGIVYYDVNPMTAAIDGGTGYWSDPNWKAASDGTSGTSWIDGNIASFESIVGSPDTTTITAGTHSVSSLIFNGAGYTITGGTLMLTPAVAGGTSITAVESATIHSGISLGDSQAWSIASGKDLSVDGIVAGGLNAGLNKTDTGTLVLGGDNAYQGGSTVTSGILKIGSSTALGTGGVTVKNVGGGTLDLNGQTIANQVTTVRGASGLGDMGAMVNSNTATTAVINGNVALGGENYFGGDGNVTINGMVTGGGSGYAVFQFGGATWTFANTTNTFDGYYFITSGVTAVTRLANKNQASSLGQATSDDSNRVIFRNNGSNYTGGALKYIGSDASTSDREFVLRASNSNIIEAAGTTSAATLTLTGGASTDDANAHTLTLTGDNAGVNSFAGVIGNGTGTISLTKSGTTTWALSGDNSYSGGTAINAGILQLGSSTALGTGGVTVKNVGGGTLDLNGQTIANQVTTNNGASGINDMGCLVNSNTVTTAVIDGDVVLGGQNYFSGDGNLTINGLVSGGIDSYAVFQFGSGTRTFANNANTFDGYYFITNGITAVTKLANMNEASSLGQATSASSNRVIFRNHEAVGGYGGTLKYIGSDASTSDREFVLRASNSNIIEAAGMTSAATLTLTGGASTDDANTHTLTLTGDNAGVNTFAGVIGNGSGTVSLDKSGTTTWALAGGNNYTGDTTVQAGMLQVTSTGSIAASSAIKVHNGATYDVLLSSQTLGDANWVRSQLTGVGIENLTAQVFTNAPVTGNVSMQWRSATTTEITNSLLASNVLTLSSDALTSGYLLAMQYDQNSLQGDESVLAAAGAINIATNGSGSWKKLGTTYLTSTPTAYALGDYWVSTTSNTVYLITNTTGNFAVIPEPSAIVLVANGLLGLLVYAWRRRK